MEENNVNVAQATQPNYESVQVNVPQQEVVSQPQIQADYVGVSNQGYVTPQPQVEGVYAQSQPAQVQEAQVQVAQQVEQSTPQPVPLAKEEKPLNIVSVSADKKIIVKTSLMKDALKKASIVATNNELIPITEVVMLRVADKGIMQVRATDRENIVTVNVPVIEATDGLSVTLKITQFKQLIDKLSSDTLAIVEENSVVTIITDSGEYSFSQAVDLTNNEVIVVPDVDMNSILFEETKEINREKFVNYLEVTSPLIANLPAESPYSGIYFGKFISSTTGADISSVKDSLQSIFNDDIFVKSSTIKYLTSMGFGDKINIGLGTLGNMKTMCVYTDNYRLYAVLKDDAEDYPEDEVLSIVDAPVGASTVISKSKLLESIDRLSIFFNSSTSRKSLQVDVKNNQFKIANENKAFEVIPVKNTADLSIKVDIANLTLALKSLKSDEVTITAVVNDAESQNGVISQIKVASSDTTAFVISAAL